MWLVEKVGGEYCFGEGNAFLVWSTEDMGDGGWSEEKRRYAVNSKQKLTKNLFLVDFSLTCWLAGSFCQNLLLPTNNLENVASRKGRWGILFREGGILFLVWTTKDIEEGGRSEEKRRYAVNSKQKSTANSCLIGSFLMCGLAGSLFQNLLLRTNEVEDGGILFWDWRIFFRGHLACTTLSLSSSKTFPSIYKSVTNIRANKSRVSVWTKKY